MIRLFVLIICLVFTETLFATDYFVDSKSGSDANPGTSPAQAWATLDAVNKAALVSGDRVLFKKGGIWRGQLRPQSGEAGHPILYGAYCNGNDKPQIRGSVPLDQPTDWVSEGSGIWATKTDTVHRGVPIDGFDKLTWDIHREGGADVSMSKNEGTYRIICRASGERSNHIQLIVRGFPVQAGKHYLLRFDAKSSKPFSLASIAFSEPGAPWGSIGSVIRNPGEVGIESKTMEILFCCTQDHDNARFTLSLGGALPKDAEFLFTPKDLCVATIDTNGIHTDVGNIILNGNKAAFKRWTREDLKQQNDFWYDMGTNRVYYHSDSNPATKYESIEAALNQHVVDHSHRHHVIFDGLDIRYGAAHGFGGTKAESIIYRNLDISWIGGADQYRQGGAGRRVRFGNGIEFWSDASDCLVENCRIWEIYDAALTNQGSGVNVERNLIYRNNTIWNCEYSFEYWNRGPESRTENIVFENNVCVDAGYGWGYAQRPDKNGRHIMIYNNEAKTENMVLRNNIFCNAKDSLIRIDSDFRDALTMENNVYWQPTGKDVMFWLTKTRYKAEQFADYQNALGLDRTSTFGLPDLSRFPALPVEVRERMR